MKITFHGAAQTVTGSQHLLEVNGHRILLDCGMYFGRRREAFERNSRFPFVGIASGFTDLIPGHVDMRQLERAIVPHIHGGAVPLQLGDGVGRRVGLAEAITSQIGELGLVLAPPGPPRRRVDRLLVLIGTGVEGWAQISAGDTAQGGSRRLPQPPITAGPGGLEHLDERFDVPGVSVPAEGAGFPGVAFLQPVQPLGRHADGL